MAEKISQQELIAKVKDLDVSDEELAGYFMLDQENSKAFAPVVIPNPALVEDNGLEGAFALNSFNALARWRRNAIYRRRIRNWEGVRIVAEGDSWFQYPLLLKDTIDHLIDLDQFNYAIYGLSAAGDLLSQIVAEDEISAAIEAENPDVLLISGGGNDMVGDGRMATLVHKYAPNRLPENYPNDRFKEFLNQLEHLYRGLFSKLLAARPHLKIICHGYDNAIPADGTWLGKPLAKQNIKDKQLQQQIVAVMIGRFNECLQGVVEDFKGSVFHVDCRNLIGDKPEWHDELHPKNGGYFKVARKFDEMIKLALAESAPSPSINLNTALEAESLQPRQETIRLPRISKLGDREFVDLVVSRAEDLMGKKVAEPQTSAERRELEKGISEYFEKIHKEANFLPSSFLEKGVERAKAVCRITTDTSYGSGFLITSRHFIMTNNHVLPDADTAAVSIAEFDYDEDSTVYTIRFSPETFFLTSRELDFTIVACNPSDLPGDINAISLLAGRNSVTRGERVNIVQHPKGRPKEVSLHDNKVSYIYDIVIRYTADTEGGSSGSPVFNNNWDLVALHHAGWPTGEGEAINEGIRIPSIVDFLKTRQSTNPSEALQTLLGPPPVEDAAITAAAFSPSSPALQMAKDKRLELNLGSGVSSITINIA